MEVRKVCEREVSDGDAMEALSAAAEIERLRLRVLELEAAAGGGSVHAARRLGGDAAFSTQHSPRRQRSITWRAAASCGRIRRHNKCSACDKADRVTNLIHVHDVIALPRGIWNLGTGEEIKMYHSTL